MQLAFSATTAVPWAARKPVCAPRGWWWMALIGRACSRKGSFRELQLKVVQQKGERKFRL
jgi:hypothetical protein